MTGQSTFFVELAETAAMLQRATSRCALPGACAVSSGGMGTGVEGLRCHAA